MKKPLFELSFTDGSHFMLPEAWEAVFAAYYGADAAAYDSLAERLRFVAGKYIEHRAWPSKFDGLGLEAEAEPINQYDDPAFYGEPWAEWGQTGPEWAGRTLSIPPTWADVAEALLYSSMRVGLMQQALDRLAEDKGIAPPRVITPEQLLQELAQKDQGGADE